MLGVKGCDRGSGGGGAIEDRPMSGVKGCDRGSGGGPGRGERYEGNDLGEGLP